MALVEGPSGRLRFWRLLFKAWTRPVLDGLLLRNAGRRLCDQLLIDLDFARGLPQCLAPASTQDDTQQEERPDALHWHNVLDGGCTVKAIGKRTGTTGSLCNDGARLCGKITPHGYILVTFLG